jgi:hypothetical protein
MATSRRIVKQCIALFWGRGIPGTRSRVLLPQLIKPTGTCLLLLTEELITITGDVSNEANASAVEIAVGVITIPK